MVSDEGKLSQKDLTKNRSLMAWVWFLFQQCKVTKRSVHQKSARERARETKVMLGTISGMDGGRNPRLSKKQCRDSSRDSGTEKNSGLITRAAATTMTSGRTRKKKGYKKGGVLVCRYRSNQAKLISRANSKRSAEEQPHPTNHAVAALEGLAATRAASCRARAGGRGLARNAVLALGGRLISAPLGVGAAVGALAVLAGDARAAAGRLAGRALVAAPVGIGAVRHAVAVLRQKYMRQMMSDRWSQSIINARVASECVS